MEKPKEIVAVTIFKNDGTENHYEIKAELLDSKGEELGKKVIGITAYSPDKKVLIELDNGEQIGFVGFPYITTII